MPASHQNLPPRHAILSFRGGIGDELLLSVPARELSRRTHAPCAILAEHPALFADNPHVHPALSFTRFRQILHRLATRRLLEMTYTRPIPGTDLSISPPWHVATILCAYVGIEGQIETQPELYLRAEERLAARRFSRPICIQTSARTSRFPSANKEWFPERFQAVADAFAKTLPIVQIGSRLDPPLAGVLDLRGKTSVRESAALLAESALFIGLEGLPMHLARAVNCPGVIIFGGRVAPEQIGYHAFQNLFTPLPCSPCWQWNHCDFDHACMRKIDAEQVINAARIVLESPSSDLAPDIIDITPETGVAIRAFLRETLHDKPHLLRGIA